MGTAQSSASASASTENMDATKKFIEDELSQHKVVIFSKSYCPYCVDTKKLFQTKKEFQEVDVVIHELEKMKNGAAIQSTLGSMSGQRTVPSVWIGGKFIGGNSETQAAYKNGKLSSML